MKPLLLIALVFSFVACSNSDSPKNQSAQTQNKIRFADEREANQYAVYDALINDGAFRKDVFGQPQLFVIEKDTRWTKESISLVVLRHLTKLSKETAVDFEARNQTTTPLKDLFGLPEKRILITNQEVNEIFRGNLASWKPFYEKYPDSQGILALSNVGFDTNMRQALVFFGNSSGSLNGVAMYVLLEKDNDVWRVKEKFVRWMS